MIQCMQMNVLCKGKISQELLLESVLFALLKTMPELKYSSHFSYQLSLALIFFLTGD